MFHPSPLPTPGHRASAWHRWGQVCSISREGPIGHTPPPSALPPGGCVEQETAQSFHFPAALSVPMGGTRPRKQEALGKGPSPSSDCHRPIVLCKVQHHQHSTLPRPGQRRLGPGLGQGLERGPFCRAPAKAQAASAQKDLDLNLVFRGEPRGLSEATGAGESWHGRGSGPFTMPPTCRVAEAAVGHRGATPLEWR